LDWQRPRRQVEFSMVTLSTMPRGFLFMIMQIALINTHGIAEPVANIHTVKETKQC